MVKRDSSLRDARRRRVGSPPGPVLEVCAAHRAALGSKSFQMSAVHVIGGGAAGLACAFRLSKLRPDVELHVWEASGRWGGQLGGDTSGWVMPFSTWEMKEFFGTADGLEAVSFTTALFVDATGGKTWGLPLPHALELPDAACLAFDAARYALDPGFAHAMRNTSAAERAQGMTSAGARSYYAWLLTAVLFDGDDCPASVPLYAARTAALAALQGGVDVRSPRRELGESFLAALVAELGRRGVCLHLASPVQRRGRSWVVVGAGTERPLSGQIVVAVDPRSRARFYGAAELEPPQPFRRFFRIDVAAEHLEADVPEGVSGFFSLAAWNVAATVKRRGPSATISALPQALRDSLRVKDFERELGLQLRGVLKPGAPFTVAYPDGVCIRNGFLEPGDAAFDMFRPVGGVYDRLGEVEAAGCRELWCGVDVASGDELFTVEASVLTGYRAAEAAARRA